MSQKLVPCTSGRCGVSNHIVGSVEHSRCQAMADRKAGGGVSGISPEKDFAGVEVSDIPPIPVPKDYDEEEVEDQREDEFEIVLMGRYADPDELEELGDWAADYGSMEEVFSFAYEFRDSIDTGDLEDVVLKRGDAGDKVGFAAYIPGSDVEGLCASALEEEKSIQRDRYLSQFPLNSSLSKESISRIHEEIKDTPDTITQCNLIMGCDLTDPERAQEMVMADEDSKPFWVERFAYMHPSPDTHRLSQALCRNIDNVHSFTPIQVWTERNELSAVDAQYVLDKVEESWIKMQIEDPDKKTTSNNRYFLNARNALHEVIDNS